MALNFKEDKMLPKVLPLKAAVSFNIAEFLKAAGEW